MKLNLLYRAKPFDFRPSILPTITVQQMEVLDVITYLAKSDNLKSLPLFENQLLCTVGPSGEIYLIRVIFASWTYLQENFSLCLIILRQDLITKKCHSKVQFGHWRFFSTLDGRPKTAIHAFPGHYDDMVIFSDAYILTRWPIFKAWQKLTDCNMLTTIHKNRGNLINIFIKSFFRSPFSLFHCFH